MLIYTLRVYIKYTMIQKIGIKYTMIQKIGIFIRICFLLIACYDPLKKKIIDACHYYLINYMMLRFFFYHIHDDKIIRHFI